MPLALTVVLWVLGVTAVVAVAAYAVEQRRREIGVRMALGATPLGIIRLMLSRTLRLAGIGIVVGLIGTKLTSGLMSHLMFGVTPGSPVLLGVVSGMRPRLWGRLMRRQARRCGDAWRA